MQYGKEYKGILNYNKNVQFLIAPMEETWFYERFFYKKVIVMVKIKNIRVNGKKSIKISFMYYMKWSSRVMLPVVLNFEEFELACDFLLFSFTSVSFSISFSFQFSTQL